MNIEVKDYLSENEMKNIAIEVWTDMCKQACNGNVERIIDNIGYHVAREMVEESLGDGANELIRDKAIKAIENLSEFLVFKRADAWDRGESLAYQVLQNAVINNKDLVDKKVKEAICQLSKREALDIIKSGNITINPKR